MTPTIFLIIIVFLGMIFLAYHIVLYFRTRVPIVITPQKHIDSLMIYLEKENLINSNSVVYELGSGWGDFSFAVEKLKPKKIKAYELSPVHIYISRLKAWFKKSKIFFERKDFFEADISDADIIYVFLVPKIVNKLSEKMKEQCKAGTIMILLGHETEGFQMIQKIKTNPDKENSTFYYFYKIK